MAVGVAGFPKPDAYLIIPSCQSNSSAPAYLWLPVQPRQFVPPEMLVTALWLLSVLQWKYSMVFSSRDCIDSHSLQPQTARSTIAQSATSLQRLLRWTGLLWRGFISSLTSGIVIHMCKEKENIPNSWSETDLLKLATVGHSMHWVHGESVSTPISCSPLRPTCVLWAWFKWAGLFLIETLS